jgi:hypothetical protein
MVDICWEFTPIMFEIMILFYFIFQWILCLPPKGNFLSVDDIYTLHYSIIIDDQKTIKQMWLFFFQNYHKGRNV